MTTVKEKIIKIIRDQPEDSSYDEILKELAFERMVEKGLLDSKSKRIISNEELEQRIKTWR